MLAGMLFLRWAQLQEPVSPLVQIYPYVVFAAGIFLGWRFHQGRLLFAILVLALADRALLHFSATDGAAAGVGRTVYDVAALLIPLNLGALPLITEWGIVTARGLARLGLIPLQLLVVAAICLPDLAGLARVLGQTFVNVGVPTGVQVPQLAILVFGIAFVLVIKRFLRHPNAIDSAFIWALLASFLALNAYGAGPGSTIYFATAGLILVTSVIETSYNMAYRDELTGLPARRALKDTLPTLGSQYTVAMLDLDHFKKVNDTHGHDVGDQLLRMIGSKLENMSGGGKVFRYGGEEFMVIFPGKSVQDAVPHLETLRATVAASKFTIRATDRRRRRPKNPGANSRPRRQLTVTVSIGVAERDGHTTDPNQVIRAADEALYRAKRAGRNRIKS
ncbi:MAG: diguanylate cyclase [Candidatus Methylomirabilales bacterium]